MVDKKRGQLDPLRAELAWSMVRILREDHDNADKNISVCQKKIEACHKKIEEATEKQREKKKEKVRHQSKSNKYKWTQINCCGVSM